MELYVYAQTRYKNFEIRYKQIKRGSHVENTLSIKWTMCIPYEQSKKVNKK